MTIIDLGTVKIRFDPQDIRVSIDGDKIDIGARMDDDDMLVETDCTQTIGVDYTIDARNNSIVETRPFLKPVVKKELDKLEKKIRKKTKYRPE